MVVRQQPDRSPLSVAKMRMREFGNQRTAFPLDMNLSELIEAGLAIDPQFSSLTKSSGQHSIDAVIDCAIEQKSVLLLGDPGSGKTMACLQIAQTCLSQGLIPFIVKASDLSIESGIERWVPRDIDHPPTLLVIDGLDEGVALWKRHSGFPKGLLEIMAELPTVATSRIRDFEEDSYLQTRGICFQRIYRLDEWRYDREFEEYIHRLVSARRITDASLLNTVRKAPQLQRLVARPLLARMLTFVHESDPGVTQTLGSEDLYSVYLHNLARTTAASMGDRGCDVHPERILDYWKGFAWCIYQYGDARNDFTYFVRQAPLESLDERCASHAVAFILNRDPRDGRRRTEFLHYSFYEWLVASHMADTLSDPSLTVATVFGALGQDSPPEIRHYLCSQLRPMRSRLLGALLSVYQRIKTEAYETRTNLIVGNLIAYLISRTATQPKPILESLYEAEQDPFLRTSLLWFLSQIGDKVRFEEFVRRFMGDSEWRLRVRGYYLYYYGDMPAELGPPYRDEEPYVPFDRSIHSRIAFLGERVATHTRQRPGQAIDFLTICDILTVRGLCPDESDRAVLEEVNHELQASIDIEYVRNSMSVALNDVHASVGRQMQESRHRDESTTDESQNDGQLLKMHSAGRRYVRE